MSVNLLKNPEKGFLRDFHFSTMGDVLVSELFGEVSRPRWINFTFRQCRDVERRDFRFSVQVDIEGVRVPVSKFSGETQLLRIPKKSFDFSFTVPDTVIVESRSEVPKLFIQGSRTVLMENAYRLYEFDPRMGWICEEGRQGLPKCPLLDPTESFSRTGLPTSRDGEALSPSCAFCGEEHTQEDLPVWAGAGMMWLHRGCWRVS